MILTQATIALFTSSREILRAVSTSGNVLNAMTNCSLTPGSLLTAVRLGPAGKSSRRQEQHHHRKRPQPVPALSPFAVRIDEHARVAFPAALPSHVHPDGCSESSPQRRFH